MNLRKSHYHGKNKSCPCCSNQNGQLVFYDLNDFGMRKLRGKKVPQSWCAACRRAAW